MRILVIEDDADLAQFLRKGLEGSVHTVEMVADGETGLMLAVDESYDLLIVDVMLPKVDGLTLCRRLRERGNVLRSCSSPRAIQWRDKVAGLDAGADDYLTKPFAFTESRRAHQSTAAPRRPHVGSRPKAKDLEMDPAFRQVWRAERKSRSRAKNSPCWNFFCETAISCSPARQFWSGCGD